MSGNVNDTNTTLIKKQVETFIFDIKYYTAGNDIPPVDFFKKKFKYLHDTSKSLFKYIYENHQDVLKETFASDINKMLDLILQIQNGNISQYDASAKVGEFIGKKYIPQLSEPKK